MRLLKAIPIFAFALSMVATTLRAQAPSSGPCPANVVVGAWQLNANGSWAKMNINVDALGNLQGTLTFPNGVIDHIRGFWTASSCRVMFYRTILGSPTSVNPNNLQIFTGHVFPYVSTNPNGTRTMAGTFEAFQGTGGTSGRNVFGWFAYR